jgi:hypothetical protein
MAAPINRSSQYAQITQAHTVNLLNKTKMAEDAYQTIAQYDFEGNGPLSSHTWTDPTGRVYGFTNGAGEITLDTVAYSGLNPADKKAFFLYLNKFVIECMNRYDIDYNL